jgi:hypothetical protein
MDPLIISFILGILIILFCVTSFVLPYGRNFKDKTQKIQGFGLNLEVSVLTLFIVIGFTLVFFGGGIWFQLRGINIQLNDLREEKAKAEARVADLQDKLERANSMEAIAFLKLEGVDEMNHPDQNEVECLYESATGRGGRAEINAGPASGTFRIVIKDINRDTIITNLLLRTKDKKRRWKIEKNIMPLQPTYELKPF